MPRFVILKFEESEPQRFVQFWRQAYQADQSTYDQNIRLGSLLDSDNVETLMRWKAGPRHQDLAADFARAVPPETLNSRREHHDALTDTELEALFNEITSSLRSAGLRRAGGIIWPIFLCHVAHPQGTPIYDVNVWRAWRYITGKIEEADFHLRPVRFDPTYLEFRKWFNGLVRDHRLDPQELDQALMAFGQFLSSRWGRLIR
jgi:hypothetical protein